jgi:hypothetical protein
LGDVDIRDDAANHHQTDRRAPWPSTAPSAAARCDCAPRTGSTIR